MINALLLTVTLLLASPLDAAELNWQQKGGTGTLSDYHGRNVVLHFWASWCPPCRTELPQLDKWRSEHPNAQLIVISLDEAKADALLFLKQHHISLPAWITTSQQAMAIGVRGLPTTMLVDGNGEIQQSIIGAREWSESRFSDHIMRWLNH
ncbi:MAG: TlpA disulfide reductase family protein [Mariprofundales bacterium]|nr:TlpA disulfide reductase family protein [Mariprofundales bacterium]